MAPDTRTPDGAADARQLCRASLTTLAVVAVPVVSGAGWIVGPDGALGALVGIGLVAVLFGVSTWLLAVATRRRDAGIGLQVAGAMLRLPLYLAVLLSVSGVPAVHGRSLAAATAIAYAVTLVVELRLLAGMPRLFWVDAAATRPAALGYDTRS